MGQMSATSFLYCPSCIHVNTQASLCPPPHPPGTVCAPCLQRRLGMWVYSLIQLQYLSEYSLIVYNIRVVSSAGLRLVFTPPLSSCCLLVVLQRRLGIWAYSLIVLSSVVFWFASLADCSRAAFQYHGLPTTEVRTVSGID